jgi:hypothetical protein
VCGIVVLSGLRCMPPERPALAAAAVMLAAQAQLLLGASLSVGLVLVAVSLV